MLLTVFAPVGAKQSTLWPRVRSALRMIFYIPVHTERRLPANRAPINIHSLCPFQRETTQCCQGRKVPNTCYLTFVSHTRQVEAGARRGFTRPPSAAPQRPMKEGVMWKRTVLGHTKVSEKALMILCRSCKRTAPRSPAWTTNDQPALANLCSP